MRQKCQVTCKLTFPALRRLQGRIAAQGSYEEVQRHPAVAELLAEFNSTGDAEPIHRPESTSSGADADDDASDTPEVGGGTADVQLPWIQKLSQALKRVCCQVIMHQSVTAHADGVPQPDMDELRIEERVTEEFMGAAPRAAALSGTGLRRRPTFRVRTSAS